MLTTGALSKACGGSRFPSGRGDGNRSVPDDGEGVKWMSMRVRIWLLTAVTVIAAAIGGGYTGPN